MTHDYRSWQYYPKSLAPTEWVGGFVGVPSLFRDGGCLQYMQSLKSSPFDRMPGVRLFRFGAAYFSNRLRRGARGIVAASCSGGGLTRAL